MQIPGWRGGDSAYRPGWSNEKGRAVFLMSDVTIRENLAGEDPKGSLNFGLTLAGISPEKRNAPGISGSVCREGESTTGKFDRVMVHQPVSASSSSIPPYQKNLDSTLPPLRHQGLATTHPDPPGQKNAKTKSSRPIISSGR